MTIMPCKTIGIIGGGQLGRMMCLAAKAMGYRVAVLDPTPGCPCAQVADVEITAGYGDMGAIARLAEASDVVTYEFENIDAEALAFLEKRAYLPQGTVALRTSQHRVREKTAIRDMGIPVPDFAPIADAEDLARKAFYPSVLKTATGGYDGKGQVVLETSGDLEAAARALAAGECILEKRVPFDMEISVTVARSVAGETSVFPVAENVHVGGILHTTVAPARIPAGLEARAVDAALEIARGLGSVGVLAVEMFVVGGEIYVNEIAPRPHNSGTTRWTPARPASSSSTSGPSAASLLATRASSRPRSWSTFWASTWTQTTWATSRPTSRSCAAASCICTARPRRRKGARWATLPCWATSRKVCARLARRGFGARAAELRIRKKRFPAN